MRRKVRAALLALALFAGAGTQASAGKQETAYTAWGGSAEKDAEPGASAGKQEIAYTAWEGSAEKDAGPGTSAGKQETA